MTDHLLAQIIGGVFAILVALAGGVGLSRRLSSAKRDRAQDGAEGSVFDNAVEAVTLDRDRWRKTAEDAWQRNRKLERRVAILDARNRFQASQIHLVKRLTLDRLPELVTFLQTDPAPFEEPNTDPNTGNPGNH